MTYGERLSELINSSTDQLIHFVLAVGQASRFSPTYNEKPPTHRCAEGFFIIIW
jgi:hypothetical protein